MYSGPGEDLHCGSRKLLTVYEMVACMQQLHLHYALPSLFALIIMLVLQYDASALVMYTLKYGLLHCHGE